MDVTDHQLLEIIAAGVIFTVLLLASIASRVQLLTKIGEALSSPALPPSPWGHAKPEGTSVGHPAAIDLKQLVARLNDTCRRALEAAAGLTISRTHYNVEIEHWLVKLADRADGDMAAILRHYEADNARFLTDLNRALGKMKTGNTHAPSLAPEITDLMKQAWLFASLEQGSGKIRSGHLLWALLADSQLARCARDASHQLLKIRPDLLKRDFAAIIAGSTEAAKSGVLVTVPAEDPGAKCENIAVDPL